MSLLYLFPDYDLVDDDLSVGSVPTEMIGGGGLQSPMSDGTIEEDFEAAFARESDANRRSGGPRGCSGSDGDSNGPVTPITLSQSLDDEDFSDIARHGIIEVVGDDLAGRKIIVISACRLPCNKAFDHQRFLR